MVAKFVPEKPDVGRKKAPGKTPEEPSFDRIELQAPHEWVARLDEACRKQGLSRSAYIRLAVNERIYRDRLAERELEGGGE